MDNDNNQSWVFKKWRLVIGVVALIALLIIFVRTFYPGVLNILSPAVLPGNNATSTSPVWTAENLKGIADNASSNNFYRAIAIQYLADNYLLSHRLDAYALTKVFVGDPYEKILKKDSNGKPDIYQSIRDLYAYSFTYFDLPISNYRIAEWYAKELLYKNKPDPKLLASFKQFLEAGDNAWPKDIEGKPTDQIGYAYWLKGMLYSHMAEITADKSYLPQAEEAFKQSQAVLKGAPDGFLVQLQLLWSSFNYAAYLQQNYPKQRPDEINSLSSFMADQKFRTFFFTGYLKKLSTSNAPLEKYDRDAALELAAINPNFHNLLLELCWKLP